MQGELDRLQHLELRYYSPELHSMAHCQPRSLPRLRHKHRLCAMRS